MDARAGNAIIDALDTTRCSDDDWVGCYALNCTAHEEQGRYPMSLTAYRAERLMPSMGVDPRCDHVQRIRRAVFEVIGRADHPG
jgi:hypothetical protein